MPCHTLLWSAGEHFMFPEMELFHQSPVISQKIVKYMTPGSLQ